MRIHHIGYVVKNIESSFKEFENLGYKEEGKTIKDTDRGIYVKFIKKENHRIELISPYDSNSPVSSILKKIGPAPYHICYEVDNINLQIKRLRKEKYIVVQPPAYAVALNGLCAFLYNKEIGIIELAEIKS